MTEDFKTRLVQHARTAVERAKRAQSEAAAAQYLVLPFFQLLGYDPLDPDEVVPEAHASFSDKFKNRVDYAISKDGEAVIAVECKKVGALNEGHRGELKGYFNAVPTVKLGVLTDGLVWQLYTDTSLANMMDDQPFVSVDLAKVAAEGRLSDLALDALLRMRKGTFDPAEVGADARRKLYMAAYLQVLERAFQAPDESLVRALMYMANMDGRRTGKLVEEHTPVVREAMQAFLDRKILERIGFADRGDLVRVGHAAAASAIESAVPA
jgi:predicted type IV restriction endonuclease